MGIDGIMETIIYLALFASAFALLGFFIGDMHGRVPKQKRDARGRFVKVPSPKIPGAYRNEWHTAKGANYDPPFMKVDND